MAVLDFLKSSGEPTSADPIFVLQGEDDYLRELVLKKIEGRFVDPDFKDFNVRRLDCQRSTSAGEIAGLLAELPTLVDHRLLYLHQFGNLGREASSRLNETWRQDLATGTVLVVSAPAGGSSKENPWLGTLAQCGTVIRCAAEGEECEALLAAFARRQGHRVDSAVLRCLRERVGDQLRALVSHLERCLMSLAPGESLDVARVEALVPFSAEVAMWKMTAAIGQRRHREALEILDHQLARGESPAAIIGYLHSYLSSLIQTAGLMRQLGQAAAVAQAMTPRKKEYQVKKTLEELRTWAPEDLESAVEGLLRADFRSKGGGGGGDPRLLLQMLILKLCSRSRGRR